MKLDKNSFGFKTGLYMIIINTIILILLWSFEIFSFNKYYEKYQINLLNKIAYNIKNNNVDLEEIAYQNKICIISTDFHNNINGYNTNMPECVLNKNNRQVNNIINEFIYSNDELKSYKFSYENKIYSYLFGIKTNNEYIFIYTPLEDTSIVTKLLKSQTIYLTIIAIIISIISSYLFTKKITKPIKDITNKAIFLGTKKDLKFENTNITELNELSKTLNIAHNEIGKTEKYKQELLANVSHDLKTPLTMIKAYAEMIKDISYKDKEKMDENLDIIIDETDRLTLLVNDILNLSKINTNNDKLNIEKYDLVIEINKIIKKYQIIKETENYNFILNMPKEVLIKADKNRINQVLYNLINNAINYTGDDKKIIINIKKINHSYLVEIKDTGKGIDKKDLNNIWNKYYHTDNNHRRAVVSTGLGLSIVKEILLLHNFDYGVESSNDGTTFYFTVK